VEITGPQEDSLSSTAIQEKDGMVKKLVSDSDFVSRTRTALDSACCLVLEGVLEGASKLRQVLRVLRNIIMSKW
jgi:hypothetical protein